MSVFVHRVGGLGTFKNILLPFEGEQKNNIKFTDVPHILSCNYQKKLSKIPEGQFLTWLLKLKFGF